MSAQLPAILDGALRELASKRPLFHSEADFQLALAWTIQTQHPEAKIRLEKRVLENPRVELDILFALGGRRYALELKYPRSRLSITLGDELFELREGAPDIERYDVVKDIARLERLLEREIIDEGCTLVLTNARGFWTPPPNERRTAFDAFRLHDGRVLSGTVGWGETAGVGTTAGRSEPIELAGTYPLAWHEYSRFGAAELRYLAVIVRRAEI